MTTIDTYFGPDFWATEFWPTGFWPGEEVEDREHVFLEQSELCKDQETHPRVLVTSMPSHMIPSLPGSSRQDLPQPRQGRYLDYDI